MTDTIVCIVDSNRGIYIPQAFLQSLDPSDVDYQIQCGNIDREDVDAVLVGPDHVHYWESWEEIVDGFRMEDDQRKVWTLHEDGDLFLVRDDHRWDDAQYSVHLTYADGTRQAFTAESTAELVDAVRPELEHELDATLEDYIRSMTFAGSDGASYPLHDADALESYSPTAVATLLEDVAKDTRLSLEVVVL